ncbi:MAG: hypothetical protein K2M95_07705 [Clostridiales bacterium]|nr:hypothetical protein [Clostridiales bacterium]
MKKRISILSIVMVLFVVSLGTLTVAHADVYEDEANTVFEAALSDFLEEECVTAENIAITKEPVYDIFLDRLGYIYTMQYEDTEGYALVINTTGIFQVTEFYFNATNPYNGYSSEEYKKIYVNLSSFLVYENGNFIDPETGNVVLSSEIVDLLKTKAFRGDAAVITTGTESFYFENQTINEHRIAKQHPAYYPVGENITNACVPAAGANVIGYWTRFYPELVPGFTPGTIIFGQYIYREWTTEAGQLVATLYYKMGTNVVAPGTTIQEFRSGMNAYVAQQGRSISYASCMSNGNFNYTLAKQKMENGIPLVLFVDGFRIDQFFDTENKMTLDYMTANAAHAITGFGYHEITYTLSGGSVRNDYYIKVATGLGRQPTGYYNINYNTTVDECYAITIS